MEEANPEMKQAYLRPNNARAPAVVEDGPGADWLKEAERLELERPHLQRYLDTRREHNPVVERENWEAGRHWFSRFAGLVASILVGVVLGLLEAVGIALGHAAARNPVIVVPPLLTFVLSLAMQTFTYRGEFGWRVVEDFVSRAAWSALVVSFGCAIGYGFVIWWGKRREKKHDD